MGRRARTTGLLLAAMSGALLGAPGAAHAAPPVEHDNERFSTEPAPELLCGVATLASFSGHSNSKAKPVKGSDGTAFFGSDTFQVTETYTTAAGTITIEHHGSFREQTATRVPGPVTYDPDGEGPLPAVTSSNVWTFTFKDAGFFRVYDSDGRLLLKATGVFKGQVTFDTLGDQVPGGVELPGTFVTLKEQTGRSFTEEQFCAAVVAELT